MEFGDDGVVKFLKDKTIIVTGSTGFLAKVFVEKVLRVQPEVRKLYLLMRASDAISAAERLQSEIVSKELFRVVEEKHGESYQAFMSAKLIPVAGDIGQKDLGINDPVLKRNMLGETNIVVNVAANTRFDERYDVSLEINTLGAQNVLEFARQCDKIELLLHVSTAYVAGSQEGVQMERKFKMGDTLSSNPDLRLDIDTEVRLAGEMLAKLRFQGSTKEEEADAMMKFGMKRSKHFGWPNTYGFTKAMGEMLLGHTRGDLPLLIMRPTIITSLYKDPVPGWMEGSRTIDSIIIGYAKRKLTCFLGDMDLIMDVIPGDMVVNAMIVAMVAHSNQPIEIIYHVSSSIRNPVKYNLLLDCGQNYFYEHPLIGKDGKNIELKKLPIYSSMASFQRYMVLRYKLPLEALGLVNTALCGFLSDRYKQLSRRYNFVMHLVALYEPYVFFRGWFDDLNMEKLRIKAMEKIEPDELRLFQFDPKIIDWDYYFHEVHIPGILKYVFK